MINIIKCLKSRQPAKICKCRLSSFECTIVELKTVGIPETLHRIRHDALIS